MSRPSGGGGGQGPVQGDLFGEAPAPPTPKADRPPPDRERAPQPPAAPPAPAAPAPAPPAPAARAPEPPLRPPAPATPALPAPAPAAPSGPPAEGAPAATYPWRRPPAAAGGADRAAARTVLSVSELTRQLKNTLERGFSRVCVRGEISGYRAPNTRGHLYFNLKDPDACIESKIWASTAQRLKFKLRDGMEVIVEGSIDLYAPQGRYSLLVQKIEPAGEGALALAFAQLKEKLQAEGLFGDRRLRPPRPLPFLARRIGVVTSKQGAALQDFLRVLLQRNPRMSVLLADARVQGDGAAHEIVRGIRRLSRTGVEVIVVTRGGGSIEDLWAFNEEVVARAIYACPVPVVSAVGHEVDYTIADFVADYRAPTPTAAAERLAPVRAELEHALQTQKLRLRRAIERRALEERQRLHACRGRLADPRRLLGQKRLHLSAQADQLARLVRQRVRQLRQQHRAMAERLTRRRPQADLQAKREALAKVRQRLAQAAREALRRRAQPLLASRRALDRWSPRAALRSRRQGLDAIRARLHAATRSALDRERARLHKLAAAREAMSPLGVLARGYAVLMREGHVVRSAAELSPGEAIHVRLGGTGRTLEDCDLVEATVTRISPGQKPPR